MIVMAGNIIVVALALVALVYYWRSRDVGYLMTAGILGLSVLLCAWLHLAWLLAAGVVVAAVILFLGTGWSLGR